MDQGLAFLDWEHFLQIKQLLSESHARGRTHKSKGTVMNVKTVVTCCRAVQTIDIDELGWTTQEWRAWTAWTQYKIEEDDEGLKTQNEDDVMRLAAPAECTE